MDRKTFYAHARGNPLGRQLTQQNVDGIDAILDEWDAHWAGRDLRCLAYILATAFHETDGTMRWDIAEYGHGKGKPYGIPDPRTGQAYYGRGYAQLTWLTNYRRMEAILGPRFADLDLVGAPETARDKAVSVAILFEGMFRGASGRGDFTGTALEDVFAGPRGDLVTQERARAREARRIVNGQDKADLIAGYFVGFLRALDAATDHKAIKAARLVDPGDALPIDHGEAIGRSKILWSSLGASAASAAPSLATAVFGISSPWAFAAFLSLAVALLVLVALFRREIAYRAGV